MAMPKIYQSPDGKSLAIESGDGEFTELYLQPWGAWQAQGLIEVVPDDWAQLVSNSSATSVGAPEEGHQFHFSVMVQGAHRAPDGVYVDDPEPVEYDPYTLTVRAWSLRAACRLAAETPLAGWKHEGEEPE